MKKKFTRTFFISFLCFVVAYGGIGYYFMNHRSEEVIGEEEEKEIDNHFDEKNQILFLLLGVDAKDVSKSKGTRTDTMMLVNIDFNTGDVKILSIPRDTRVDIRGLSGKRKINAAHANGGPELSVKTVQDLLGVDLDYYVKVDYKVVKEVVDAIGGVEMDVPMNMKYDDPTADPPLHINLGKGVQVLNGDKSLQFLRFRKGYKDADIGRIKAQQQFMKAFMEQALKPKNLLKLPKMISAYYKYVDTNIPMGTLTKMAFSANKINTESIRAETLPGVGKDLYPSGKRVSYWIYDIQETDVLVQEMFSNYLKQN